MKLRNTLITIVLLVTILVGSTWEYVTVKDELEYHTFQKRERQVELALINQEITFEDYEDLIKNLHEGNYTDNVDFLDDLAYCKMSFKED